MWNIGKGILSLLDNIFNVINQIWRYQFFNNEYVNKICSGAIIVACSWLAIKVVIELIMNHIVKNEGKGTPISVYKGMILSIVMMFLITPLFTWGHQVSTALTEDVVSVSKINNNSGTESKISATLISAMIYKNETFEEDAQYFVENWKTVKINTSESKKYKYSINFFMLIVLAIVTIFLLFFVAIQMAKRVMELALHKIIGAFCCTSLTNSGRAFETWSKNVIGLFVITTIQFIAIGLMLNMFSSAWENTGTMTSIFLMIGALLFVITTPTIINSLLGQTSGISSALGDMQSMMAIGHSLNTGLSPAFNIGKAGMSGALSMGSNVANSTGNFVKGGANKISSMLNNGKSLLPEQLNSVKESFAQGDNFGARRKVDEFMKQNGYKGSTLKPSFNPSNNLSNLRYDSIRNHQFNVNQQKKNGGI